MPYIPPEVVAKAKEMDLLTYLKNYEPSELVHFGGSTYCTRTHDSLKISNGKWCWFSRGIGGKTALDYLIKVREIPFTEAVEMIVGQATIQPPTYAPVPKKDTPKVLLLPPASRCATHAVSYLSGRGIDREVIFPMLPASPSASSCSTPKRIASITRSLFRATARSRRPVLRLPIQL